MYDSQRDDVMTWHYSDVIISAMASQITSLTIVYSIVYSGRSKENQSSASLAFVRGIHRWQVNPPPPTHTHTQRTINEENVSIWWRHHGNTFSTVITMSLSKVGINRSPVSSTRGPVMRSVDISFFLSYHEQTAKKKKAVELPGIWDAMALM